MGLRQAAVPDCPQSAGTSAHPSMQIPVFPPPAGSGLSDSRFSPEQGFLSLPETFPAQAPSVKTFPPEMLPAKPFPARMLSAKAAQISPAWLIWAIPFPDRKASRLLSNISHRKVPPADRRFPGTAFRPVSWPPDPSYAHSCPLPSAAEFCPPALPFRRGGQKNRYPFPQARGFSSATSVPGPFPPTSEIRHFRPVLRPSTNPCIRSACCSRTPLSSFQKRFHPSLYNLHSIRGFSLI